MRPFNFTRLCALLLLGALGACAAQEQPAETEALLEAAGLPMPAADSAQQRFAISEEIAKKSSAEELDPFMDDLDTAASSPLDP